MFFSSLCPNHTHAGRRIETKMLKKLLVLTALGVVISMAGCGAPGPVSWDNAFQNTPPRVRRVAWVVPASLVVVDYQPYDATRVEVDGWAIRSDADFNNASTPRIHLYWNLRDSLDTTHGRGFYLLADEGWSGWSGDHPIISSLDSYLLISVHDPDGQRVGASVWRLAAGGGVSQVARTANGSVPDGEQIGQTVSMPVTAWQNMTPAGRLELATKIMKSR